MRPRDRSTGKLLAVTHAAAAYQVTLESLKGGEVRSRSCQHSKRSLFVFSPWLIGVFRIDRCQRSKSIFAWVFAWDMVPADLRRLFLNKPHGEDGSKKVPPKKNGW